MTEKKKKILIVGNDEPTKIDKIIQETLLENDKYIDFSNPKVNPYEMQMIERDMSYLDIGKSRKEREAKIVSVRTDPKIRRNILCPCGSNLKFKNCCLLKK